MSSASSILVPLDFSEQSLIALDQSYNLARLTHSEITLLHVIDQDFISHLTETILSKYNYADQLRDDMQARLDETATKIQNEQSIKVHTIIRSGKIYDEIVEVAQEIEASLIIMGTMGASTFKKKFLGSNASHVIKTSQCPVITIKGKEHRKGCRHIVLPLDLTKETKEKVDKAVELAKLFRSVINIITVINTDDEYIVNALKRQMSMVKAFVEDLNVECTGEFIENDSIAEGILEYSKKIDADLIIIMTQQELEWTDFFIGSAAQEVINHSDIPVLSIRPVQRGKLVAFVTS